MNTPATPLVVRRYGPGDAAILLDTLADVWAEAHAGHDDVARAGFTPDSLRRQISGHAPHEEFTLIAAFAAGQIVGFGYGFRCSPAYWYGEQLLPAITPEARDTDSLAGICELAVRPSWQGQGVGTRLHTALLEALRTEWVSLLAMPGNDPARRLYDRLGYQYAGPYRPGPDGPVLDLLLLRTTA
ncbi:GNAT family N-acetyltransferase [Streptomyces kaniharaensis]|uniref:GNAT family N-acetyltransferase n=1 Tax=Streptomyces kaniharaensis TaxID=212423 RepID=A0A6N7L181_9ACTN|nr:GNAT family N-acetyltransferase [Streptomyces kaniharaensis]MQS17602.1 GNAT family N-acetyltransferase [Streptomyces kaniharaensis]